MLRTLLLAAACCCLGCQGASVSDVDVLCLSAPHDDSDGRNWHRSYIPEEQAWWQATTDREPPEFTDQVRADCEAYLARTGSKPENIRLVYLTFHARLWVLQYVPKDPGPGRAVFGGIHVLWYDSLKRKVVAETYAD